MVGGFEPGPQGRVRRHSSRTRDPVAKSYDRPKVRAGERPAPIMTNLCTPMDPWEDRDLYGSCLLDCIVTVSVTETINIGCLRCVIGYCQVESSMDKTMPLVIVESICFKCLNEMQVWVHSSP